MEASGLDALLVSHLPNVRYLCGFSGSAGALLVKRRHALLFTDGRYRIQAAEEMAGAKAVIARGDALVAAARWAGKHGLGRVGFEAAYVSVAARRKLAEAAGSGVTWRSGEGWVEEMRARKEPAELDAMRDAARLGSGVFGEVLTLIRPGIREVELAAELEYRMRCRGASGPAFETIVAFGERTALPHARPTTRLLRKNELVLLDWGAILRGYCCDLTRSLYVGRAPNRFRRWHQAVLEAQEAARRALRPGVPCAAVDAAARRALRRHGLERYFTHSTGHGLGLEVHEAPRLGRGQKNRIETGHVVTVEPGVYLEGVGGIRIEDDVAVTPSGTEILTSASREFIQL
jgi:Xaa-Pro aminopeptidase